MILLLHHRYRHPGGEERAVEDLAWLIRERLGEEAEVLERDSAAVGPAEAALGLVAGGLRPRDVAAAVRLTGARVVHAHNTGPTFGWRALAAARAAGARVVLHLHNYRLVCAVATCFTRGEDCLRCHGRNTWPGVRLNCRGGSRAEAAAYGLGIALWQRRLAESADAILVPSEFALGRLRALGAPLGGKARVLASVQREFADRSRAGDGAYVLAAGRLTPEKGFADLVRAARLAGLPLVVAGDGPELPALRALAADGGAAPAGDREPAPPARGAAAAIRDREPAPPASGEAAPAGDRAPAGQPPAVRFVGRVAPDELAALRAGAAVAAVPSRYAEILPLAALEAMAAGLPVVAARAGGLAEAVPEEGLYPPGDVDALAQRLSALWRDAAAGERALAAARARSAPEVVAAALRDVYNGRP